jgi:hypothetical protein
VNLIGVQLKLERGRNDLFFSEQEARYSLPVAHYQSRRKRLAGSTHNDNMMLNEWTGIASLQQSVTSSTLIVLVM